MGFAEPASGRVSKLWTSHNTNALCVFQGADLKTVKVIVELTWWTFLPRKRKELRRFDVIIDILRCPHGRFSAASCAAMIPIIRALVSASLTAMRTTRSPSWTPISAAFRI